MTDQPRSVDDAIGWLPPRPFLVESTRRLQLQDQLRKVGFKVFDAYVDGCGDERCLLVAIGDALGFPEYFGANWAALEDCIGDMMREDAGSVAVVINGMDSLLRKDLHAFVRSVHLLSDIVVEVERRRSKAFRLEMFFLGSWVDLGEALT